MGVPVETSGSYLGRTDLRWEGCPPEEGDGARGASRGQGAHLWPSFPLSHSVVREGEALGDFYADLQLSRL